MGRQASAILIGIFVVGAIGLAVAAVLVFGSGQFFVSKIGYVMYFEGSLGGLDEGAAVNFRGVRVGTISDISVLYDNQRNEVRVPVIMQLEPDRIAAIGRGEVEPRTTIDEMVKSGLRAQLVTQSLITGKLAVQLDFHPEAALRLVGPGNDPIAEFPTVPSTLEQVSATLESLPLQEIGQTVLQATDGINRFFRSPELLETLISLNITLTDLQDLLRNVNEQVGDVSGGLVQVSNSATAAFAQAKQSLAAVEVSFTDAAADLRTLVNKLDGQVGPVSSALVETSEEAKLALAQARETLSSMDGLVAEGSPLRHELESALADLSHAARSIRDLSDYLERNPDALISGKETE